MAQGGAAALLCLGLAACGGSGSGSGSGTGGSGGPVVVTPPPAPSISFDPATTTFPKDRANFALYANLFLTVRNTTTDKVFLSISHTKALISGVVFDSHDPNSFRLELTHRPPRTLYNGTYSDRITVRACLDEACSQPLSGSPLSIPVSTVLSGTDVETGLTGPAPDPDPEVTPLPVLSRVTLPHDVVDAEYSRTLDRAIMAATYPVNALYIYDPATGTATAAALSHAPTAVSVSPDGLTAAVGHRGFISVVELPQSPQQPAVAPRVFTVSRNVFDLALDGRNQVHFVPRGFDDGGSIHTLDLATGSVTPNDNSKSVYNDTYIRLHPGGDFLFHGDPGTSSTWLEKWDVRGPRATFVTEGIEEDFGGCAKLWFDEPGVRVFSPCGTSFGTAGGPGQRLSSPGRIELSYFAPTIDTFRIDGMDHSSARNEIALTESNFWCAQPGFNRPCFVRFRVFDGDLLIPRTMNTLEPIYANGALHTQLGMFVFFNASGSRKVLLTRLDAMAEPEGQYLLSVLD